MVGNQSNYSLLLTQITERMKRLCPNINQVVLHNYLSDILSQYDIRLARFPNMDSDIREKVQLFLSAKKLEGLAETTLSSYQLELRIFGENILKPVDIITTNDIRLFLSEFPHLKMSSVSKKLSVLKSFFGWLVDE